MNIKDYLFLKDSDFFPQRYDTEQECEGTEECTGTWFTTLWGDCTEPCGGGTYTREVLPKKFK